MNDLTQPISSHPGYYQFPTIPIYPVVTVEVLYALAAAQNAAHNAILENERLQQQLKNKAFREDAYTRAYPDQNRTWAITESGRHVMLMDACLENAFWLSFPAPSVESWDSVSACEMQAGKGSGWGKGRQYESHQKG